MKKKELVLLVCSIISIVLLTFTLCIYLPPRAAKMTSKNENDVWMQDGAQESVLRPLLIALGKQYGDFAQSNGLESFKILARQSRVEPYFTNGYYFGTSWRQFQRRTLVYYVYASHSKEAIQKGGWMDAIAGQRHEIVLEKP